MKPIKILFMFGILFFGISQIQILSNINTNSVNGYTPFTWSNNLTDYNSEIITDAYHGSFAQKFSLVGEHGSNIKVRKTFWQTFTRSNEISFWGKSLLQPNTYIDVIISVRKDTGQWYVIDTTSFSYLNNDYYLVFFFAIPTQVPNQFNQIEFNFILDKASGSGTMSGSINLDYMYSSQWGGVPISNEIIDDFGDPVGIVNQGEIAEKFSLSQNYPNPFNPKTNIEFSISEKEFVKLVVYDGSGREIETLVNEELSKGTYKFDWNASNLSSGTYFYRITTENFTDTKKMILVK